jgi:hypothetical protein
METIQFFPATASTFPVTLLNVADLQFLSAAVNTTGSVLQDPMVRDGDITDLGEAGYQITHPIKYRIERLNETEFLASIPGVNIAISGDDWQDAYQALVAEILDVFDTLTTEPNLGPDAAAQLAMLSSHIVKA